jgi:hypothetical protein
MTSTCANGQAWEMVATQSNCAPYNDSLDTYQPWLEFWINIQVPISCYTVGDTVYSSVETHRIEILDEQNPQTITLCDIISDSLDNSF